MTQDENHDKTLSTMKECANKKIANYKKKRNLLLLMTILIVIANVRAAFIVHDKAILTIGYLGLYVIFAIMSLVLAHISADEELCRISSKTIAELLGNPMEQRNEEKMMNILADTMKTNRNNVVGFINQLKNNEGNRFAFFYALFTAAYGITGSILLWKDHTVTFAVALLIVVLVFIVECYLMVNQLSKLYQCVDESSEAKGMEQFKSLRKKMLFLPEFM